MIALGLGDHLAEAHRSHDRVAFLVEQAHHVGALGLLVDEKEGLLAGLLVEVGQPQRARGERQRIELVEQHALHLVRQRRRGLRVQAADLGAHLTAAGRQGHHRGERERRGACARKEQRQFHSKTHSTGSSPPAPDGHKEADVRSRVVAGAAR